MFFSFALDCCSKYAGFSYDRYWMIVTEAEGRFVTQRQDSRLAIIETHLPEAAFSGDLEGKQNPTVSLTLSAPGVNSIRVSKSSELAAQITYSQLFRSRCWVVQVSVMTPTHSTWKSVRCHDWKGDAIDEGDAVADWLTTFLKQKVRLVKYGGKPPPSTVILQTSCNPAFVIRLLFLEQGSWLDASNIHSIKARCMKALLQASQ